MDEERATEHTETHTNIYRYYLFRRPRLSPDLERTINGRCSAFMILTVFLVALLGGTTVHRK